MLSDEWPSSVSRKRCARSTSTALPSIPNSKFELDREAVCRSIEALKGKPLFYLDEGEDRITCAEVVRSKLPPRIKLYAIRRQNLPSRDDGAGVIGELALKESEGLAEAIHLRLYPNSIVAAEFFYYGPRISRLETFLNERCGQDIVIKQLLRGDAIERALKFHEIRVLRVKIHPSNISKASARELGFDGLMATAKNFDADVYADVTLRAETGSGDFTKRIKSPGITPNRLQQLP
jgi:hypothetical protein